MTGGFAPGSTFDPVVATDTEGTGTDSTAEPDTAPEPTGEAVPDDEPDTAGEDPA